VVSCRKDPSMIGYFRRGIRGAGWPAKAPHVAALSFVSALLLSAFVVLSVGAQEQGPPTSPPVGNAPSPPRVVPDSPAMPAPAAQSTRPGPAPPAQAIEAQFFTQIASGPPRPVPRFQFTIAPETPVKDLLPVAPAAKKTGGPTHDRSLAD